VLELGVSLRRRLWGRVPDCLCLRIPVKRLVPGETAGLMEKKFLNETVNWFFVATLVSVLISFIAFKRVSPTPKEIS